MHVAMSYFLLILVFKKTYALNISFTSEATAATTLSFAWVSEPGDGADVWLRKQRQPEEAPPTLISHPYQVHLGDQQTGNSGIDFLEAGLYCIFFYDQVGPNGTIKGQDMQAWVGKEKKRTYVQVLPNPTSSGIAMISKTATETQTPTPAPTPLSSSSASPSPSNSSSLPPKLALIVGLSIAAIALLSIGITIGVFYGKRKRSQQSHKSPTEAHPAPVTPYHPSGEVSRPETLRRKDIRQPRNSGETRNPGVETEMEERRFIRHEDSGIMLEDSSYGTGSRSENVIHLPPTYSEVNFVR
ncbi:hypothetical protein PQX77_010610 [Marasmius sp. AFHP31]|nr:hypothetical protein PQX77_010610 [Marasmius sp. AFHP31]